MNNSDRGNAILGITPHMEQVITTMEHRAFDLRKFAGDVKKKIPTYAELKENAEPKFQEFLCGLRERLREKKESGITVIIVLGTGGTFQSEKTPEGYEATGKLDVSFKALGLPEDPTVHLEFCDLMNLDSSQMTVEQWRFLAEMICQLEAKASDMFDEIIVTHGTDTMSKGASYLSFMLKGFPKSIIFTGSQRPAIEPGTDAKDQMERAIATAKLANNANRRITEVMVACGLKVARATWAKKRGDATTNAFGPWNDPHQTFDATDWSEAASADELYKLAPALLDFGTGKGRGKLQFADHAVDFRKKGAFEPFTEITDPADIYPASLTDKSHVSFARHLIAHRVAVLTQLGSATADDGLIEIALAAVEHGKIAVFEAPFHDSTIDVGTYKAGKGALRVLPNILRRVPIINTSPSAMEAKSNFLLHKLRMKPAGETEGMGIHYSAEDLIRFFDQMEQNLVGELV